MDKNSIEELLSQRYIQILANRSGFDATKPEKDFGVDLSVKEVSIDRRGIEKRYLYSGRSVDIQLKSCKNLKEKNGYVKYSLEKKTYNDYFFRKKNVEQPYIIIIFQIPKDENDWIQLTPDQLVLKKCAYYYVPDGTEKMSICYARLKIPTSNRVDINFFNNILNGVIQWK